MKHTLLIFGLMLLATPVRAQQTSGLPFCFGYDCLDWMDDTHCYGTGHSCDDWVQQHYVGPHPSDDYILILKCHDGGVCQPYAPCRAHGKTWFPDASGQCNAKDEPR